MKTTKYVTLAVAVMMAASCGTKSASDKPVAQQEEEKKNPEGSEQNSSSKVPENEGSPQVILTPGATPVPTKDPEAQPTPESKVTAAPTAAPTATSGSAIEGEGKAGLYGVWKLNPAIGSVGSLKITVFLKFDATSMTVTSKCESNDVKVLASASAPAAIDERSVTVLEEHSDLVTENGLNCRASISKTSIQYVVKKNELVLTQGLEREPLTRVASVNE